MAGASQLGCYQKALRWLEERPLVNLNENRESLRLLNAEWSDALLYILAQGYWKIAIRTTQGIASTELTPNFGYLYAFPKPDDWVATYQVADNEVFQPLLRDFDDANGVWYCNVSLAYFKYVSSDPNYGLNLAMWTPGMVEYLAAYLAKLCCPRLKQSQDKIDRIEKIEKKARSVALSRDAMDLPPGQMPYGTWVQARAPRGSILPYGAPYPWANED